MRRKTPFGGRSPLNGHFDRHHRGVVGLFATVSEFLDGIQHGDGDGLRRFDGILTDDLPAAVSDGTFMAALF